MLRTCAAADRTALLTVIGQHELRECPFDVRVGEAGLVLGPEHRRTVAGERPNEALVGVDRVGHVMTGRAHELAFVVPAVAEAVGRGGVGERTPHLVL